MAIRPVAAGTAAGGRAERPPFYCVHSAGGHVLSYQPLADRLGDDQPVYGLEDARRLEPAAGEAASFDTSVGELADRYAAEILAFHPGGPFLLGGWSFGGLVAYEIARRLERSGRPVALVALLDTEIGGAEAVPASDAAILAMLFAALGITEEGLAGLAPDDRLEAVLAALRQAGSELGEIGRERARGLLALFRSHVNAHRLYAPAPYGGGVTLFRARDEVAKGTAAGEPGLAWARWAAGGVETIEVAGDHNTLVRPPQVEDLARRLRESLDRALGADG